jgi:site-specific recombinase XerC
LTARAIQQRVAMWSAAAGLPDGVSPHWFRHSRAMNIMKRTTSNDPRGIVQAALGHASIASTGIYTGVTREDLAAALDEVDGAGRRSTAQLRKNWERRAA